MEPIPYFYDSLDRNAILVRLKRPHFDWAYSFVNNGHAFSTKDQCNIYLVRAMANNEAVMEWIRTHFDALFVNELNDRYKDEDSWP